MPNRYFDFTSSLSRFVRNTLARATDINDRLDEVSVGFGTVQTEMDAKAPLASPTFTGTPAAPNPASVTTDSTQIATTAWVQDVIATASVLLPLQTGNAGKVLKTDGSAVSWDSAAALALPTQTSNSGKFLSTDGSTAAWQTLTADGTEAVGFRHIPQITKVANGAPTTGADLTYAGKHIYHTSTAGTFTIPANASVAFPVGTALTFVNGNGAGTLTIDITTDTMRLAGAGTTGPRSLAANGVATAIKVSSTEWIISGGASLT